MRQEVKILNPYKNSKFGYIEQSAMALLFILCMVEVVSSFRASAGMLQNDAATTAVVHSSNDQMLAKK